MTHVALVTNTGWSMAQHRREQIRGLVAQGWRVTAIADYRRGEDLEVLALGAEPMHVPCEGSSLNPWKNSLYVARLTNLLLRLSPDLVHYFSLKVMLAGSVAAQLAGVRSLVGTVTGQGILGTPGMTRLKVMLRHGLRLALPARAVLVFQNQDDRNAFITADIIDANRTAYIPGCGVDVARLAAQPIPRPAPKRFIHASRMLWSKGVAEFVEAARRVKRGRPEAEFALYGGCAEDYPSKNPDFIPRAWLEEVDQEGVVRWHGRVPSETIERTLLSSHSAAAALLSCYAEGVPRFLIEAAACGLPIITTDHPGCRDTVLPDRSGYLCHPESRVAGAARAMVWLLCDPAKQNRMGAAGREHAMQFDQGRVLADTLEVYRRMLR